VPILTVIAGPNGSGKSTLTQQVDFEGRGRLLDPDAIARGLNPLDPSSAAFAAGREVLHRIAEYLGSRVDFAVETTLSGRSSADLTREAKAHGYQTNLIFVGLDSPERCIARIRNRAARGGHFVPDTDVRRRYARSMANGARALRSADAARVYDNSGDEIRLVLVIKTGTIVWRAQPLPKWVEL
jgi:predicted ABC-type ATPase